MELEPADLLDASRRWLHEADILRAVVEELRRPPPGFGPELREAAEACGAAWAAAAAGSLARAERCADGLSRTAALLSSVDDAVGEAMHRLLRGVGR